ncbi:MAG: hypothetical protein GY862_04840 [Gammaproteobacteria bacterium]|nr:hypothetical protein [Gammaproteobacteria bacterium]
MKIAAVITDNTLEARHRRFFQIIQHDVKIFDANAIKFYNEHSKRILLTTIHQAIIRITAMDISQQVKTPVKRQSRTHIVPVKTKPDDHLVMTRQLLDDAAEESKNIIEEAAQGKLRPYVRMPI